MEAAEIVKKIAYRGIRALIAKPNHVVVWPPVQSQEQMDDLIHRIHFHFPSGFKIHLHRANPNIKISGETPYYLHNYDDRFVSKIKFVDNSKGQGKLHRFVRRYGGVLLNAPAEKITGGKWLKFFPNVAPFDPSDVEMETFWVSKIHRSDERSHVPHEKEKFREWTASLPRKKKIYLLCTGPSLSRFRDFDFSDGHVIACNSVVSNHELMEHTRPEFVVATDPIFHFGPSVYAEQFRQDLAAAAKRHKFLFMTLDSYRYLLGAHLAMPSRRVCTVPNYSGFESDSLSSRWRVPRSANILTMFMIPLARALGKEIYIIGADGREPGETYFWKHDPASQLTDKMQAIKDCHPAFFAKRDYADYYDRHCEILRRMVEQIESDGGHVYSLTPSFIPVLKDRPAPQ